MFPYIIFSSVALALAFDNEEIMFRSVVSTAPVAALPRYKNSKQFIRERYRSADRFITLVIGAHDGTHNDNLHSVMRLETKNRWYGYFVEPVKLNFEKLVQHYNGGHRLQNNNVWTMNVHHFLHAAVSEPSRIAPNMTCPFYSVSEDAPDSVPEWVRTQISKLDKERMVKKLKGYGILEFLVTTHIPCYDYDSLIKKLGLTNSVIDYVQVDVEGFDYDIIKMISESKYPLPRAVFWERKIISRWKKDVLARDLMTAAGYSILKEGEDDFAYLI